MSVSFNPPPSSPAAGAALRVAEVGLEHLDVIRLLNMDVFDEQRVINTFERDDLMMLLAYVGGEAAGFKVGYRESTHVFYSAKGGVLPAYRRQGLARHLLYAMMERARARGYRRLAYDTFPNRHPGMAVLGFAEGFRITKADYNPTYRDFRLRFEKDL